MPRMTPRRDTEQLAWAVSGQYPTDSDSSPARNHSRKQPRSSRCTAGVNVQAPPMLIGSMSLLLRVAPVSPAVFSRLFSPAPDPIAVLPLCFTSTVPNTRRMGQLSNNTLAYAQTQAPPAVECAWCGHQFGNEDDRLTGRVRCSVCGVATTSPWPSDEQLGAAYADWYRPTSGRFSGLGDKVLRRTRSALADRLHRLVPPGQ